MKIQPNFTGKLIITQYDNGGHKTKTTCNTTIATDKFINEMGALTLCRNGFGTIEDKKRLELLNAIVEYLSGKELKFHNGKINASYLANQEFIYSDDPEFEYGDDLYEKTGGTTVKFEYDV